MVVVGPAAPSVLLHRQLGDVDPWLTPSHEGGKSGNEVNQRDVSERVPEAAAVHQEPHVLHPLRKVVKPVVQEHPIDASESVEELLHHP